MEKILAAEKAEQWAEEDEVLGVPVAELKEALLTRTAINFAQSSDITFSEDAEWRATVEVPRDRWEADKGAKQSISSVRPSLA